MNTTFEDSADPDYKNIVETVVAPNIEAKLLSPVVLLAFVVLVGLLVFTLGGVAILCRMMHRRRGRTWRALFLRPHAAATTGDARFGSSVHLESGTDSWSKACPPSDEHAPSPAGGDFAGHHFVGRGFAGHAGWIGRLLAIKNLLARPVNNCNELFNPIHSNWEELRENIEEEKNEQATESKEDSAKRKRKTLQDADSVVVQESTRKKLKVEPEGMPLLLSKILLEKFRENLPEAIRDVLVQLEQRVTEEISSLTSNDDLCKGHSRKQGETSRNSESCSTQIDDEKEKTDINANLSKLDISVVSEIEFQMGEFLKEAREFKLTNIEQEKLKDFYTSPLGNTNDATPKYKMIREKRKPTKELRSLQNFRLNSLKLLNTSTSFRNKASGATTRSSKGTVYNSRENVSQSVVPQEVEPNSAAFFTTKKKNITVPNIKEKESTGSKYDFEKERKIKLFRKCTRSISAQKDNTLSDTICAHSPAKRSKNCFIQVNYQSLLCEPTCCNAACTDDKDLPNNLSAIDANSRHEVVSGMGSCHSLSYLDENLDKKCIHKEGHDLVKSNLIGCNKILTELEFTNEGKVETDKASPFAGQLTIPISSDSESSKLSEFERQLFEFTSENYMSALAQSSSHDMKTPNNSASTEPQDPQEAHISSKHSISSNNNSYINLSGNRWDSDSIASPEVKVDDEAKPAKQSKGRKRSKKKSRSRQRKRNNRALIPYELGYTRFHENVLAKVIISKLDKQQRELLVVGWEGLRLTVTMFNHIFYLGAAEEDIDAYAYKCDEVEDKMNRFINVMMIKHRKCRCRCRCDQLCDEEKEGLTNEDIVFVVLIHWALVRKNLAAYRLLLGAVIGSMAYVFIIFVTHVLRMRRCAGVRGVQGRGCVRRLPAAPHSTPTTPPARGRTQLRFPARGPGPVPRPPPRFAATPPPSRFPATPTATPSPPVPRAPPPSHSSTPEERDQHRSTKRRRRRKDRH